MTVRIARLAYLVAAVAMATACVDGKPKAQGLISQDTVAGIPRLMASGPIEAGRWHLEESSRFELPTEGQGAIAFVRDIALFDDGSIAVADLRPAAVHLFDSLGRWQRQVGTQGSGPGEYEDAFLARRGDTLIVQDRRNSRAIWYSADGNPLRHVPTACCITEGIGIDGAGRVLVPASNGRDGAQLWVRVSTDATSAESLTVRDTRFVAPRVWTVTGPGGGFGKQVPLVPSMRVAVDPREGFVVGWSGEYQLRRTMRGDDTLSMFGRTLHERVTMDEAERAAFAEQAAVRDAAIEGLPVDQLRAAYDPDLLPTSPELFDAIWVDPAGRTWVQRTGGDSATVQLDLFDGEGRLLDEVRIPTAGWPTSPYVRPVAWTQDAVAVAVQTDEGFRVIRYRIMRRE